MKALALYASMPWPARFHTRVRAWTCPMEQVVARVPESGKLLEVGCGHGLFANEAALTREHLQVVGIDPAPDKIRCAQASVQGRKNVRFAEQRLADCDERDCDALAVLDVLYLIPRDEWPAFFRGCFDRLRAGGRLLLKEVDTRPRYKFYRCVLQEQVSVRLLGITLGARFAFAGRAEMSARLASVGFEEIAVQDLGRGYLTPHILYEAVKP